VAIAWTDVANLAPGLPIVATGSQIAILAAVNLQVSDEAWGTLADTGRCYLAAHLATVGSRSGGAAGSITSEAIGPMSRSYGFIAQLGAALGTTAYGAEYRRLLGLLPSSLGLVP
jgi:hypothetical protein